MSKHCCKRFEESVTEGYTIKADRDDETAWFLKDWLHIYYCPFCGVNIRGKGFGRYDVDLKSGKKVQESCRKRA